ncbi:glycosyltransferase [Cupriavidus necator]|uniref:Glycosyltransferase n=2 Tax=Cupriavidus necator TaxID=106590 RepID=A0A367PID4_CUPNE|nr:glycosyltransferase [Cupriavidus necator]RCJ06756.1 glycosyltransferase [Cupriavidus necator]
MPVTDPTLTTVAPEAKPVDAPRATYTRARPVVHQFHSGSAPGDAVTNAMLMIRGMLRQLGFESEIYVQHVAPELTHELHSHLELGLRPEDVLVLHHSMGHDLDEWILQLPSRNVLCYHNITPTEFFPPTSPFRHYSQKGRRQLIDFRPVMARAIAVSELNASELRAQGYDDVRVLPLLFDVEQVRSRPWNEQLVVTQAPCLTVLFVGRVSPHKGHADLIRVLAFLRAMCDEPVRLVCVGAYEAEDPYYQSLLQLTAELQLRDAVLFTGKVSDEDLGAWYRVADVFLCMSEHEGFGVPLIEAMALDVPVVAFDSSNIAATMGDAGFLVKARNHGAIAALVKRLFFDRPLRTALLEAQRKRVHQYAPERLRAALAEFLGEMGVSAPAAADLPLGNGTNTFRPPRFQIEGPLESSYSLALVNREIAAALERLAPGETGARPTEGPGDYAVDMARLNALPGLPALVARARNRCGATTLIRNLYPPRVADMDGERNLLCFAWEETGLDPNWVAQFNTWLDGIGASSHFVKKVLRDNGVRIPITVYGHGVEHLPAVHAGTPGATGPARDWKLPAGFRFLHVSSCFPRKGVDVLIDAFCEEFHDAADVALVVKTFPNPHNTEIARQIRERRAKPGCPQIRLIDEDVSDSDLHALYASCDAFVAPSRGEGFGLPMAEAMMAGLPVVTTAHGGQTDFCRPDTAWLVDYRFELAKSHLGVADSMWAEPDRTDLRRQLRALFEAPPPARQERTERARSDVSEALQWDKCVAKLVALDDWLAARAPFSQRPQKLGWVSSWNAKCGIATYSSFLLRHLNRADFDVRIFASTLDATVEPDEANVHRCWSNRHGTVDKLLQGIDDAGIETLMIQHNFGFLSTDGLADVVRHCRRRGITVLITFHSTKDIRTPGQEASLRDIAADLAHADRLIVHSVDDVNRLKSYDLVDNVCLFPHGVTSRVATDMATARAAQGFGAEAEIIAAYGFLLPHKGLEELIAAFPAILAERPNAQLLLVNALYPGNISRDMLDKCKALARSIGCESRIRFETDFLPDEKSFALLDCADVVVFPYQETAESASGAIRYGIASHRPVACSPLPIFSDVADIVHALPGTSPAAIAEGLVSLLASPQRLASTASRQAEWLCARAWPLLSYRLAGMMQGLRIDQEGP